MYKSIGILLALVAVCFFLQGCGCGCAKKVGEIVGESATDFGKGVGAGADEKLKVDVELTDELKDLGFSHSTAKMLHTSGKGVCVYLIAAKEFNGTLVAKAYNEEGQEIGRANANVEFKAGDAKNIDFFVDSATDAMMIKKYVIGLKK